MTAFNSQHTLTSTLYSQLFSLRNTIDCFVFLSPWVIFLTFSSLGVLYALFLLLIFSDLISSFIFPFQLINQLTNSILNPWWLLSWVSRNLKILSVESIIEFGRRSSLPPLCLNHVETTGQVCVPQIYWVREVVNTWRQEKDRKKNGFSSIHLVNGNLSQSSFEYAESWKPKRDDTWTELTILRMAHGRKK